MSKNDLAKLWKDYDEYLETDDTDQSWRMRFPSSILSLNRALGNLDGIPQGILHIIGDEAHGKTTLAYNFLAEAQKKGIKEVTGPNGKPINAIFLDFERTYSKEYAAICGVDTSKVLKVVTEYDEDAFDIALELMAHGIQVVIVDSIPAVVSISEEDKGMKDAPKMANEATLLGRATKRFVRLAYNTDALVIYINQWRSNISTMSRVEKKYYGARIIRHLVKYTIELTRVEKINDKDITIQAFIPKTKDGSNGSKIEYKIIQGNGINTAQNIISLAVDYGIVECKKPWYYYPSRNDPQYRGQGEDNAIQNLPIEEIKLKVLECMKDEK